VIRSALVIFLAGYALVVVWLFVIDHGDAPIKADAVVVLSGAKNRLPVGVRLMHDHEAPLLVVSRNDKPTALEQRACAHELGVETLCFRADPFSTKGEAERIGKLAKQRGWDAVDVVTSKFHSYRAKLMIERCYHGRLALVDSPNPTGFSLLRNALLEPAKLAYHELRRSC
jgi:uncharacterized SAM-binding protein YcdF (DUF218 family)